MRGDIRAPEHPIQRLLRFVGLYGRPTLQENK